MFSTRSIPADHKDLVHDVSYDFYGRRFATCSSDQYVKVSPFISTLVPALLCGFCEYFSNEKPFPSRSRSTSRFGTKTAMTSGTVPPASKHTPAPCGE